MRKEMVPADNDSSGKQMERFVADQIGVLLIHPYRKDAKKRRYGNLAGMRQCIEAVYDTVKEQLNLGGHGGRTPTDVFTRVAQRLLALATAI
ncbi:hypothetical protein [Amycolatopsis cihanbeyliensis]|uniref:hypothetical protein n=1 Tax=Amycolatopsis cihanbeyliensis TaxID=1128664 RepID=UPI001153066B|nr:hypothetical protein [Amycolatopsis cihanbeyliensis]